MARPVAPPRTTVTFQSLGDYDVSGAIIHGKRVVAVWDTLALPDGMRDDLPLLEGRELVVVYSHADWDHVWGTAGLPVSDARIVAHRTALTRFGDDVPRTLAEKRAAEPGRWESVVLVPPTEVFDQTTSVDLGGLTLELHHLPGHTPDCIVGFVPETGAWLGGDTVEVPFPVIPDDAPLDAWIAGLERWESDERVGWVLPAHGGAGGRAIITDTLEYLRGIRAGRPVDPGPGLDRFYAETHAQNLRWRAR